MSIQSEIDRINNAKAEIVQAISEKGVAVAEGISIEELPALVENIEAGIDTSDATATAANILANKTAYVKGEKVTGTMPNKGYAYYDIDGLTTDEVSLEAGYYMDINIAFNGAIYDRLRKI